MIMQQTIKSPSFYKRLRNGFFSKKALPMSPCQFLLSFLIVATYLVNPASASLFKQVKQPSLVAPTSFSATSSNFDDLASNVSARRIGGIFITGDLEFGFSNGLKKEDEDTKITIPSLLFSQGVRIQLDEGIDLGIKFQEKFISGNEGGYATLFNGTKTGDDSESLFVFGTEIYISSYLTQTVFSSFKVGGKGWLQANKITQGQLFMANDLALAAPIIDTGFFIRPELGIIFNLEWKPNPELEDSTTSTEDYWSTRTIFAIKLRMALSYRREFKNLLTFEGLFLGFGNYVLDPRLVARAQQLEQYLGVIEPSLPGGDFDGRGWEGGFSLVFSTRIDEQLLQQFYPLSKLGFNLAYTYTKINNDLRFHDGNVNRHVISFLVKFQLW